LCTRVPPGDETHLLTLLLQAIAQTTLTLTALKSEDIKGTARMKVATQIKGLGRHDSHFD
jgi:hypothetical protein